MKTEHDVHNTRGRGHKATLTDMQLDNAYRRARAEVVSLKWNIADFQRTIEARTDPAPASLQRQVSAMRAELPVAKQYLLTLLVEITRRGPELTAAIICKGVK